MIFPVMTGCKPPCLKTGWITGQVREIMVQTTAEAPVTMNTAVNQVRKKKRGETGKPMETSWNLYIYVIFPTNQ